MIAQRLLNVAKALRECPAPNKFTMSEYHFCGTPGCAFGNYAARIDLQNDFQLDKCHGILFIGNGHDMDKVVHHDSQEVLYHFHINAADSFYLFGHEGCGGAKTSIDAAEFIENFVRNRS